MTSTGIEQRAGDTLTSQAERRIDGERNKKCKLQDRFRRVVAAAVRRAWCIDNRPQIYITS
jgi:hypothetical protein